MAQLKHLALCVLVSLLLIHLVDAYKQKSEVKDDERSQFLIENFGYKMGGKFFMKVTKFEVFSKKDKLFVPAESYQNKVFFFTLKTETDSSSIFLQENEFSCSMVQNDWRYHYINMEKGKDQVVEYTITDSSQEGFHNLYFINCHSDHKVTFELHLEEYNYDGGIKDYLPVGLSQLPLIYAIFTLCYVILFVIWIFSYMRGAGNIINKVHYLMTILVALKIFSLFFYAMEQHFVKFDGNPKGWDIAYYIFAVLKTSFFFVIVTLIGTGWSFFKPFLSDKDKKIIIVVIPLQIIDNIAMVFVNIDDPGSVGLLTWRNIFRLVDIICCGAVLIPIIWSIKHLREASQSDGKAARNLQKLKLFRQFYLIIVSYIYFTRIIIYLFDTTLPYYLTWMGDVFTELATLSFFVVVGYKFRPVPGNPYFNLEEEDAARLEDVRTGGDLD